MSTQRRTVTCKTCGKRGLVRERAPLTPFALSEGKGPHWRLYEQFNPRGSRTFRRRHICFPVKNTFARSIPDDHRGLLDACPYMKG